ncbi:MAG: ABC transporter permease, partial [Planctomycetota bacterium]
MFSDIFNNPEILRNLRYRLRPKTIILSILIVNVLFISIGILALLSKYTVRVEDWRNLFLVYAWFAIIINFAYAVALTTTSIVGEKDKKTYDYLFMTPLSDRAIAIGKLIGSTVNMWLILATMLPYLAISGMLGLVDTTRLMLFFPVLILGALFSASLGLLISVSINKMASGFAGVFILIIIGSFSVALSQSYSEFIRCLGLLSPFTSLLDIQSRYHRYNKDIISFFGIDITAGWLTIFLFIWLTYWIMKAVSRRVRNLQGVFLTQIETLIFFIVFEIFMVGCQWEYLHYNRYFNESFAVYLITNGVLLIILSLGLTLSRENYFSYIRNRLSNQPYKLLGKQNPAHFLFVLLAAILIVGFIIMCSYQQPLITWLSIWVLIATVSVFYLLVQWLKTILLYSGPAISFVIFGVVLGIPPIVIAVFDLPDIFYAYLNPIAYITEMRHFYKDMHGYSVWTHPILISGVLLVMLCLFIWRH